MILLLDIIMDIFHHLGLLKSASDLDRLVSSHRPLSLWSTRLSPPPAAHSWDRVGGLREAKRAMVEAVIWPGKVRYR